MKPPAVVSLMAVFFLSFFSAWAKDARFSKDGRLEPGFWEPLTSICRDAKKLSDIEPHRELKRIVRREGLARLVFETVTASENLHGGHVQQGLWEKLIMMLGQRKIFDDLKFGRIDERFSLLLNNGSYYLIDQDHDTAYLLNASEDGNFNDGVIEIEKFSSGFGYEKSMESDSKRFFFRSVGGNGRFGATPEVAVYDIDLENEKFLGIYYFPFYGAAIFRFEQ